MLSGFASDCTAEGGYTATNCKLKTVTMPFDDFFLIGKKWWEIMPRENSETAVLEEWI